MNLFASTKLTCLLARLALKNVNLAKSAPPDVTQDVPCAIINRESSLCRSCRVISWPRALRRYQWAPGGVNEAGHATPKSSDSFLSVVIGLASSIE
jgi:hypothetical protein